MERRLKGDNHYTDKDMTSEEFISLLKGRLERGETIEGLSYTSSNGTKVILEDSKRERIAHLMITTQDFIVGSLLSLLSFF